ncbi:MULTISPECIES: GNAT family N-acetyltransferase [Rathayibacter]|uniref:GNAT family N-acetyltransferase n=1 Tax=Rathayibacter TaxID=33886 RepID=UPI001F42C506|nr:MULTISPECIES: GNAT family N-acetyltransferase [Rathayibacter]
MSRLVEEFGSDPSGDGLAEGADVLGAPVDRVGELPLEEPARRSRGEGEARLHGDDDVIATAARGRGIDSTLLAELIAAADDVDLSTIQASIFPENTASLTLHNRAGFRCLDTHERIAQMTYGPAAGRWRDTILIERRRP